MLEWGLRLLEGGHSYHDQSKGLMYLKVGCIIWEKIPEIPVKLQFRPRSRGGLAVALVRPPREN